MNPVTKWLLISLLALLPVSLAAAVELKLTFPQNRTVFQTNERIDVSVVRSSEAGGLPAGVLTLTLAGETSTMTFTFELKGAAAVDGEGSATDHLHLNGWLIKPGTYTLTATMGGASDKADIDIFSHIRKSSYRVIRWEGPRGDDMRGEGEDGLGFNLYGGGTEEMSIREKMDITGWCAMGSSGVFVHQYDSNLDCDWSDPYVYLGAIQRGMDTGLSFRTMPNAVGVHLIYEPGLTWNVHPYLQRANGEPDSSPHDIPSQRRAYESAFDKEQPWANDVDIQTPEGLAAWTRINEFKLGYLDAFWKASRDAVERIKPGALALTGSMYGWNALYDGYYFNNARSLPVIAGHGSFGHNSGTKNMNPSFVLEFSLPRQKDKPTWYRPGWAWYTAEQLRLEQYMSFITGIQGLAQPMASTTSGLSETVQEINQVASRLGTIFVKPAYTKQAVAVLYSKSDTYRHHAGKARHALTLDEVYLATRLMQCPITAVVEEDVLDGTLAGHRAVIVAGVEYLDPAVVDALADFAAGSGVVIVSDDVTVDIPGATKLGMEARAYSEAVIGPAIAGIRDGQAQHAKWIEMDTFTERVEYVRPLAKRLGEVLAEKKILPPFRTNVDTIAAGYQVRGEIEYILAVNFTIGSQPKPSQYTGFMEPGPAAATITLPDNGRPVYDALVGKEMKLDKDKNGLRADLEFAGGDMKVFARPARPIGGVLVASPVVRVDLTREGQPPIQMDLAATLVDKDNNVISGTAPLQIVVKDPAGNVRYDLFRATDLGVCSLTLPLAANDTGGTWTVEVTDLLAGTKGEASFEFKPLTRARSLAGATHRAVFFGDDKANIYRFFRDQRNVTIAVGDSDYNRAAAERLVKILKPYNITAEIVLAKTVPARELTDEEAHTWCGTVAAGAKSGVRPGRENSPAVVGWELPHPVIVLGTPEDNVMLSLMKERRVLPYTPDATFPGRGNGMVAWNLHTLGHDVHALVCIAYDAAGMSQAVGTLFELGVGLDPLLPLALPSSATIEVAK